MASTRSEGIAEFLFGYVYTSLVGGINLDIYLSLHPYNLLSRIARFFLDGTVLGALTDVPGPIAVGAPVYKSSSRVMLRLL